MMTAKALGVVAVLLVATAFGAHWITETVMEIRQASAVTSPTHAMLRVIVQEMKAGHHERAQRMTQRLEAGLLEYLRGRGPTPEQFYHDVIAHE